MALIGIHMIFTCPMQMLLHSVNVSLTYTVIYNNRPLLGFLNMLTTCANEWMQTSQAGLKPPIVISTPPYAIPVSAKITTAAIYGDT